MITAEKLKFTYGPSRQSKRFVLGELNFSIENHDFVALIGPNGSGKSTLLKLLSGFLQPDEGKVYIKNKSIDEYSKNDIAKVVAFVPQSSYSVFPYTIYEIISMGRNPYHKILGFEDSKDKEIIAESISLMELDNLVDKSINEVSGGEAQRAFIARALAQEPSILLLDEPNSHLDIKHQLAIFEILGSLNFSKQITIVLVSHDINQVANYCKRIILIDKGKIISDGLSHKVITPENINKTFGVDCEITESNDGSYRSIHFLSGEKRSVQ